MGKAAALAVSCLMVTSGAPERLAGLRRAIEHYAWQSYADRELVVVLQNGSDPSCLTIPAGLNGRRAKDVRFIAAPPGLSLGALRNIGRHAARGDILVQWDDDDLHHPRRIEEQLHALRTSGAAAVGLEEAMQYFPATRTLRCINWRATSAKCLPGTLMWRRDAPIDYPESGADSRRGEDSAVVMQLQQRNQLHVLCASPCLYVYVSHGANTWPDEHHRMLAERLGVTRGLLRRREALIRAALQPFDFGPGEVLVEGSNGPAFALQPATTR